MTDDMGYDLANDLRESAKATFYDPIKSELNRAASRIEKLEAALRSIAANACCDSCREAALVARKALEGKDD
jgi:hypothetical protein